MPKMEITKGSSLEIAQSTWCFLRCFQTVVLGRKKVAKRYSTKILQALMIASADSISQSAEGNL